MSRLAAALLTCTLVAAPAMAGTLSGVVRNGTTGAPAASQEVILIALQGGMEAVASATTDAQGRYSFDRPEIGQAPMLVRVIYKGANYHQNVPPGRATADVEIFEPTATPKDLQVASRMLIVQPNGPLLLVGEEYSIRNKSSPPGTFTREFEFRIPEGAELNQVAAWGPAGMPVVQGTTTKGTNHFGVPFPLRPGENGVRISYQMAYATNAAKIVAPSVYPADSVLVIAPPTMQIEGAGLRPAGSEQGWNVFARDALAAGAALEFNVSGTAPPPSPSESAGGQVADPGGVQARAMPGRLDNLQWALVAGLSVLFVLGAVLLLRKPLRQPAKAGVPQAAGDLVRNVETQVARDLDQIKDTLFRLELRRQAGTISEQEYAAERGRTEQVLRDLVKG
jgi:hypothetical protein